MNNAAALAFVAKKLEKGLEELPSAEKLVHEHVNCKEQRDTGKDRYRDKRPLSTVVIYFGDQIARRDIERDAARDRKGIRHRRLNP